MKLKPVEVEIYRAGNGVEPFTDWLMVLKNLDVKAIIRRRINHLMLGNFGDCKAVGNGVFELRIHVSPGYRVYYALVENKIVLLLCGGEKKSQKRDIKKAKEFLTDYQLNN